MILEAVPVSALCGGSTWQTVMNRMPCDCAEALHSTRDSPQLSTEPGTVQVGQTY